MKVTNLRRKLASALVAGGMLLPSAAVAADLNTNLLLNPGFENLDPDDSFVLDWTDGTTVGFTYNFNENYDNGGPLAGGGELYFSANGGIDITGPGQVSQLVDLSTGASAALIASGNAAFRMSGFFTSFLNDGDFGTLQVDLLDAGGATLLSDFVSDSDVSTWTEEFTSDIIPVGTTTARVSVFGTALAGGPDGYIDNVDFRVVDDGVILPALEVRVDREDGSFTLSNRTGSAVNIAGYQITSAFGALDPANWVAIADNYDGDSGGSEVDDTNNWSKLTVPSARGDLSEGDLDSGTGGTLANNQSIVLGGPGAWIANPNEDLVFQYISDGSVERGIVRFRNLAPFAVGDLDTDGDIDADDWAILRSNQHTSFSGDSLAEAYRRGDLTGDLMNNHPDFVAFKAAFDAANGAGSFIAMLSSTAVPEPTSVVLVLATGLLFGVTQRQRIAS